MDAKLHPPCTGSAEERTTGIAKGGKGRPCPGDDIRPAIKG